jgi:hypothetical protein
MHRRVGPRAGEAEDAGGDIVAPPRVRERLADPGVAAAHDLLAPGAVEVAATNDLDVIPYWDFSGVPELAAGDRGVCIGEGKG